MRAGQPAAGELPPDVTIVRLYGGQAPDERLVNANQLCRVDGTSPADIARADRMLRGQIQQVVDFLRKRVKGFENCRLTGSAEAPGFREDPADPGRLYADGFGYLRGENLPGCGGAPRQFLL